MAGKKRRGELALLDDRHKLAQLALDNPGASSTDLSLLYENKYGIKIPARTIRYDLQQLKKKWLKETERDIAKHQAIELKRIDNFEQHVWDAWRASMVPFEKVVVERLHKAVNEAARAKLAGELAGELADQNEYLTEEVLEAVIRDALQDSLDQGDDAETFINKVTTTTEGRVGDPRYLSQIHAIQQERRKIMGVYAPELHQIQMQKIELKGYAGGWSPDDWGKNDIIDGEVAEETPEKLGQGTKDD